MAYDLEPVNSPRAAGALLRTLVSVLENPLGGALLSPMLLRDAGILLLRDTAADDPLPSGPASLPLLATPTGAGGPPADLRSLVAQFPEVPGFRPEGVADFLAAYRDKRLNPETVARRVLDAVAAGERRSPAMRVFIAQDERDVMAQAAESARRWREGRPLGPLDGVPVAVKDELDQRPYPTTVGTRFLGKQPAGADAFVVGRLREAGALLVGKANMHEIGIGVTGVNPHHGAARNPHDPRRMTGGSSSGPGAAVAAGLCPIAIGADGGGSIRVPAALCGVVGLKPTFGRVSESGAAPLCWSVAHVGPLAASVDDCALAYAAIAGPDPADANSLRQPPATLEGLRDGALRGVRLGIYRPWFEDADPAVVAACRDGVELLVAAGARVVDIEIPELAALRAAHLVTIVSEMAASHLRLFQQHRDEYAADTRVNLALARRLAATDYVHAQRTRARLAGHFQRVLQQADAIVTPTSACTAPVIPVDSLDSGESNVPQTLAIMRFAPAGNLLGLPAVSVPAGYDGDGMPVGLQLMGRAWEEHLLLRLARVVEAGTPRRQPQVHHRLLG